MVGIVATGAYIPLYRLGPYTKGLGMRGEKAVANCDEDSITMAVTACHDLLAKVDRSSVDALYFATTSAPYLEKLGSTTVAVACDLRTDIGVCDFSNSIRAGTMALKAAVDAVKAGSAKRVLVVASDMRVPKPGSEFETVYGDAAAAFLIGDSDVAAEIGDSFAMADEILDYWRPDGDVWIQGWEERFCLDEGYLKVLPGAIRSLLEKTNTNIEDISKIVYYAPDPRRHGEITKKMKFNAPDQVQDSLLDKVGNAGAAHVPLMLVAALEQAKPSETILVANYGSGGDAFLLKTTDKIGGIRGARGVELYLNAKQEMGDYMRYLQWRGLAELRGGGRRPPPTPPSAVSIWRERKDNIRFYGARCNNCGYRQYPSQRVCTICESKDDFTPEKMYGETAELYTYSLDYIAPHPNRPTSIGVVNFKNGGRAMLFLTDYDADELKCGMELETVFRDLGFVGGFHNYAWKGTPVRA
jgi:hydroxymethylglutaryl-CoA synthase